MNPKPDLPVEVSHRRLISIALPMTIGYVTTPLVGVVAIGVIGRSGDAALTGGVALATLVVDVAFGVCNFLRSGTTGLTAQAVGRGDRHEMAVILGRALILALAIGLVLAVMSPAIRGLAPTLLAAGPEPARAMADFLAIRLLAAPLVLANFALFGWLLGQGRSGAGLIIQTVLNGTDIILSLTFVLGFGWGVAGAAWAAVAADLAALAAGLAFCLPGAIRAGLPERSALFDLAGLTGMLRMNGDILVRTLVLYAAFSLFAREGAAQGDTVLAANAILDKLFLVGGYFLDGIAAAAETLVGQSVGARSRAAYDRALSLSLQWGGALAAGASAAMWIGGAALIAALTTSTEVRAVADAHLIWAALTPLAGFVAFVLDGVFIGATWSRDMRNMMLLSLALFLAALAVLMPAFGNHGLWAAFLIFLGVRGVSLGLIQRRRAAEIEAMG